MVSEDVQKGSEMIQGLPSVTLTTSTGARAVVLLHGAHVVSWVPEGAGEQLYLSPRSKFAAGQAVRGGVPVIFPQFAEMGPGARHGFARTQLWKLVRQEAIETEAWAQFRLVDTEETRALWPHAFELTLTVRIRGRDLSMEFSCLNTGKEGFDFTSALHTYIGVSGLAHTRVEGLSGVGYFDSAAQVDCGPQDVPLRVDGEVDRIYWRAPARIELHEATHAGPRRLECCQEGFQDTVVWNPGPEKCARLSDMPADGFERMICIEAAQIGTPVVLSPGQVWRGVQTLRLL